MILFNNNYQNGIFITRPFYCLLFIILFLCVCTPKVPRKAGPDTLTVMARLATELKINTVLHDSLVQQQVSSMLGQFVAEGALLDELYNLETLTSRLEQTWPLDTMFLYASALPWPDSIAIAFRKLRFRTLAAVQERMEELYRNDDDYTHLQALKEQISNGQEKSVDEYNSTLERFEKHGDFTFKEKVSWLLVVTQYQDQCSRVKTTCLQDVINLLPELDSAALRRQCWQAIAAMLEITNVLKSEYGYIPFQCSSLGIITEKGVLLNTLSFRQDAETDPGNIKLAQQILTRLQKQLNANPDKEFLERVKQSQASRAMLQQHIRNSVDNQNEKIYETDSLKAAYWFKKGFDAGNPQDQIAFYSKAILLDNKMITAYNNRGNIYQSLSNDSLAIRDYSQALSIDPFYGPAFLNRGNSLQNMKEYRKALQDYDSAVMFSPDNFKCYFYRGQCYRNMEEFALALADYNKVMEMCTDNEMLAMSAYFSGVCYSRLEQYSQAFTAFERALQLKPTLTVIYLHCGDIYRQQQNYKKAIEQYDRALVVDSINTSALYSRGICYKNLSRWQAAEQDFLAITRIDPNQADAWYYLGAVYWEQRQWSKVIGAWEKCLAINPEHTLARQWLPKARQYTQKRTRKITIEKIVDE